MSSRRQLPSKKAELTVACGWDNPLATYFCTVSRDTSRVGKDSDPVVLWLGLGRGEVRTPEEMAAPLEPYADLDETTIKLLRADRAQDLDRAPTILQRQCLQALRDRSGEPR